MRYPQADARRRRELREIRRQLLAEAPDGRTMTDR
jgi:hypothetical protein